MSTLVDGNYTISFDSFNGDPIFSQDEARTYLGFIKPLLEGLDDFELVGDLKMRIILQANGSASVAKADEGAQLEITIKSVESAKKPVLETKKSEERRETIKKPTATTKSKPEQAADPLLPPSLENPTNTVCYANAAFQLMHQIPTLKQQTIDLLEGGNPLKSYAIGSGLKIVHEFNSLGGVQLHPRAGNDSAEIFGKLMSQTSHVAPIHRSVVGIKPLSGYSFARLNEEQEKPLRDCIRRISDGDPQELRLLGLGLGEEEPFLGNIVTLRVPDRTAALNFSALVEETFIPSSGLITTQKDGKVELQIQESRKFIQAPETLMVKIPKRDLLSRREYARSGLEGIPERLDLSGHMAPGVAAPPLVLKGFTHHSGSGTGRIGGHTTAYFKKQDLAGVTKYFHANDTVSREVSYEEFMQKAKHASELYYDSQPY